MRLPSQYLYFLLLLCTASLSVAASWGFEDATVSVNKKGAGVGGGLKEKYAPSHRKPNEYTDSQSIGSQKTKLCRNLSH